MESIIDAAVGRLIGTHLPKVEAFRDTAKPRWKQETYVCNGLSQVLGGQDSIPASESTNPSAIALPRSEKHELVFASVNAEIDKIVSEWTPTTDETLSPPSKSDVLHHLLKGFERRKLKARLVHNTTIPFNSLPTEIGNEIFTISLLSQGVKNYYPNLLRLRLVCTLWFASIDAEPSFWTLMFNELQRTAWQNSLSKSHQSPFLFFFLGHNRSDEYRREFPRSEFLDTAASQIHRARVFYFGAGTSWPYAPKLPLEESLTLKSIMASEAPLLEELTIHSDDPDPTVTITFDAKMPRMKVVRLTGWSVSLLDGATFGNLRALDLRGSRTQIHLKRLVTAITTARNLVHLKIQEDSPGELEGNPPVMVKTSSSRVATLPSLRTIIIYSGSRPNPSSIISFFKAPNCDYMHLSGNHQWHGPANLIPHFANHIRPRSPAPSSVVRVRCWKEDITVDGRLFHLEGRSGYPLLSVMMHILEAIPKDGFLAVPVHVSIEDIAICEKLSTSSILEALDMAFPDLVELSVPPEPGYLNWLDRKPSVVEVGEPPRFLFPNMKRLTLCGNVPSTRKLRNAVSIAATRRVEHVVQGHRVPPRPLEAIRVVPRTPYDTPCYRRVLKEARGIVTIKCDAPWRLAQVPDVRHFFSLAWEQGPLYPPDDGMRWVDEVVDEVQVVEPEKYFVSTSDEEEIEWP